MPWNSLASKQQNSSQRRSASVTAPPSGPWGVKRLWIVEDPGLKLAPGFASYL